MSKEKLDEVKKSLKDIKIGEELTNVKSQPKCSSCCTSKNGG